MSKVGMFFMFLAIIFLAACGGKTYVRDRLERVKVIKVWTSSGRIVVQLKGDGWVLSVDEQNLTSVFLALRREIKIGDCVKVWVIEWKDPFGNKFTTPFGDRDLIPCDWDTRENS